MLTFPAEVEQGGLCLLVSTLTQRWQSRETGGGGECRALGPALGQLDSAWIPTLAPASDAASDKSLHALNLVFSFVKKIESTRMHCFQDLRL